MATTKATQAGYDQGDSRITTNESYSSPIDIASGIGSRTNVEIHQASADGTLLLASLEQLGDNATRVIDAQNRAHLTTVASLAQIQEFLSGAQTALGRFTQQFALPVGILIAAYGVASILRAWRGK